MPDILHASAVAFDRRAVLILGPSGSGKSGLALELIARGGILVADDRVVVTATEGGPPLASPPPALAGRIEARAIGLLRTPWKGGVPLALAVDLGQPAEDRLPPPRTLDIMGQPLPVWAGRDAPNLAAAIVVALTGGVEVP